MRILCLTATCGRHAHLERSVGMFLNQDYEDKILFIHNNSPVEQTLGKHYDNIYLVNNSTNPDGSGYKTLGEIYTDSLELIWNKIWTKEMDAPDVIVHWDDDDLFLPNHLSEGAKGYFKARLQDKLAYKPKYSYFRHIRGIDLMQNTLEPSIFVDYNYLDEKGYSSETTAQHLQWVNPLVYENKILVDEDGIPTLIYNWNDNYPTFKTSGDPHNPNNFNNYRSFSTDHGDKIITPWITTKVNKLLSDIMAEVNK